MKNKWRGHFVRITIFIRFIDPGFYAFCFNYCRGDHIRGYHLDPGRKSLLCYKFGDGEFGDNPDYSTRSGGQIRRRYSHV